MKAFSALLALREIKRSPLKGPIMRTLAFLWYGCTLTVKQVVGWLVIWDYITFTWRHCNVVRNYTSMSMGSLNWKKKLFKKDNDDSTISTAVVWRLFTWNWAFYSSPPVPYWLPVRAIDIFSWSLLCSIMMHWPLLSANAYIKTVSHWPDNRYVLVIVAVYIRPRIGGEKC